MKSFIWIPNFEVQRAKWKLSRSVMCSVLSSLFSLEYGFDDHGCCTCGVVLCLFSIWTVSVLNDVSCLLRRPQLDDCSVTNMLEAAFDYFSRRYIINILLKTMEDERLKQSINCFERAFVVSPAHSSRLPLLWRNCLVTVPQSNRLLYGCSL